MPSHIPEHNTHTPNGGPDPLPPELAAAEADAAGTVQETTGSLAPVSSDPLPANILRVLDQQFSRTFAKLSGGQVTPPASEVPDEGLTSVPPELFTGLTALEGVLEQAAESGVEGAEGYRADLDLATKAASPSGIKEIIVTLQAMENDDALAQAFAAEPEAPPVPTTPPDSGAAAAATEPEFNNLV